MELHEPELPSAWPKGSRAGLIAIRTQSTGGVGPGLSLPPTLTAQHPAHLHLSCSYKLTHSAHTLTGHNSLSPSPC